MTSSPENPRPIKEIVDDWTNSNTGKLLDALEAQRRHNLRLELARRNSKLTKEDIKDMFSTRNMWLSEMRICEFWNRIEPPSGFELHKGNVYWVDESTGITVYDRGHQYAVGPGDEILCFTPGQFFNPAREEVIPGERTQILVSQAPELVSVYAGGLVRVFGGRQEIADKLTLAIIDRD